MRRMGANSTVGVRQGRSGGCKRSPEAGGKACDEM